MQDFVPFVINKWHLPIMSSCENDSLPFKVSMEFSLLKFIDWKLHEGLVSCGLLIYNLPPFDIKIYNSYS